MSTPVIDTTELEEMILNSDNLPVRMEIVNGVGIWEAMPGYRHQRAVRTIERSVRPILGEDGGCDCIVVDDLLIRFPDGSLKRPDLSILCREPDEAEFDTATRLIPEAVIEVISKGSEKKDIEIGVPFYLANGVKDILIVDPYKETTMHYHNDRVTTSPMGTRLFLACGCECTA